MTLFNTGIVRMNKNFLRNGAIIYYLVGALWKTRRKQRKH
jgi:gamma-glutamylcysteine synthetase